MDDTTLEQALPPPLREYVEQRVRDGSYADTAEYLRDLVRRDREDQALRRLRELIEEGLASGPATPLTEGEIESIRARAAAAAGAR